MGVTVVGRRALPEARSDSPGAFRAAIVLESRNNGAKIIFKNRANLLIWKHRLAAIMLKREGVISIRASTGVLGMRRLYSTKKWW